MPREINAAGYRLIKEFEAGPQGNSQPALTPYLCPAGVLTIGWGHIRTTRPGMVITRDEAQRLLDEDLDWAEECVDKTCPGSNDNEFASMVSLTFNIGAAGFKGSTAARLFNKGDKAGAAAAMLLWRKFKNPNTGQLEDSPGLIRRRGVEQALFLTPSDSVVAVPAVMAPLPIPAGELMPQAVAPPPSAASSKTVIAGGASVVAGATTIGAQIDTITPVINSITTMGASFQNLMKLGALTFSIIAFCAAGYMLYRYIQKRRNGEVLST